MTKPKTAPRARYTLEFKQEAVRLLEDGQTGLLQRPIQGAGRNVDAWLSRYGHRAFLRRMMKLPVTALYPNLKPPIGFQ